MPLLPNLKGLVLYGASPPPSLCSALASLPKLEDLEFFMFTDWRLPRELGLVTGLKEIDVNPDRFLSESDEELDLGDEDEAADESQLAHWSSADSEVAVPRSVWYRSKETLRNWVWANRKTVRKVTVYDQSEACLPLRYVRPNPSNYSKTSAVLTLSAYPALQILQPQPDIAVPTFPLLSTLSLASTPHITHSALSLALSPPENPKGPLDPNFVPVVADDWFLHLLPHVPLLENLTLSYNLTDAPSPYYAPSEAASDEAGYEGSLVDGADADELAQAGQNAAAAAAIGRNHRQRTDYSLLPYYLNPVSAPSFRALRKLDLRLLSISPASALTRAFTAFPNPTPKCKHHHPPHPVSTAVASLKHLSTLEDLSLTVGKLEFGFLAALAAALADVRGFRSLGIEVCAGGWVGVEGEDGDIDEGDGVYWGLRDGLLWGADIVRTDSDDHLCPPCSPWRLLPASQEIFARALAPLTNLRSLQTSDSHSTFTRTIRFPSLLRGHCTPTFLASVVRLRSLLTPEQFQPTAETFGRHLPSLERVRWVTGGLREAGDDEDEAGAGGGGGGGREGRGGEEVVLRDELWAKDRRGEWVLMEAAVG